MQVTQATPAARPWWRYGMVWMVVGGPLVVVVAAIATAVIAFRGADPEVRSLPQVVAAQQALQLAPALVGRNHAATGAAPAGR